MFGGWKVPMEKSANYRKVYETLKTEILSGKYSFKTAFPSSTALSRRFGIARFTIRQALDILTKEGLIKSQRGRGTFVTKSGANRLIGLIVPGVAYSEFFPPIVMDISRMAQEEGYLLILGDVQCADSEERAKKVREVVDDMIAAGVSGVIFHPVEFARDAESVNRMILEKFKEAGVQVVLLDRAVASAARLGGYDVVGINNFKAGYSLAEHLMSAGARRIGYLTRNGVAPIGERYAGVKAACDAVGKAVTCVLLPETENVRKLAAVLKRQRLDAVVCANDDIAAHLCQLLAKAGLRVPEDVLVAGFDDVRIATLATPALTSVHQPCEQIAATAFRQLVRRIQCPNLPPVELNLPASVVVRESTCRTGRVKSAVRGLCRCWIAAVVLALTVMGCKGVACVERRISVAEYCDRMEAAWLGQIAGVSWGVPTEFKFSGQIVPSDYEGLARRWEPQMINGGFDQDDVYVEITFLQTLDRLGYDTPSRRLGIEFANSAFRLWHANYFGRNNLRLGIAPPASGHPLHNGCHADIDYQIEADFSGIVAPGLPQAAIELGERFGRLMNYGDGVYAGQFVGALYSAAFFERDRVKIVESALACIPSESRYAEMVRDVIDWYRQNPDDWQIAWRKIVDKYGHEPGCTAGTAGYNGPNINAALNGGMVLLGLLWGHGDIDRTILISTRGGYDSDCNPSTAAGVLFTSIGRRNLPKRYYEALDRTKTFECTGMTFDQLKDLCARVARKCVVANGGRIERNERGDECFVLPVVTPRPSAYEDGARPSPCEEERYTDAELSEIRYKGDEKNKPAWGQAGVLKKEKQL